jgi:mannan endo-1,4-beta-mannosidase
MRRRFAAIVVLCVALLSLFAGSVARAAGGPLDLENIDVQSTSAITPTSYTCSPAGISTVNFAVSGPATGPYPGTYTGSGSFTIGPQTESGYPNNNGRNVGPILSFNETYTIHSGDTTITGTASLTDPPPGAGVSGARLNTAACSTVSGATLGSVTNATGTEIQAYATVGITADPVFAPAGSFAYAIITRQFISSSSIGPFDAGEFAHSFRSPSAPPPSADFVSRSGAQLQLNGQAFRPIGLNIYNANSNGWCWYPMDGTILADSLTSIGSGKNALRAWFFQQLATTNGARDWTAFDRTLATARAHGYKVVATLVDQWGDCGVTNGAGYGYKDVNWYQSAYKQTDGAATVSYREWAQQVAARYRNDPTILAWQLVNEPEVKPSSGADCSTVPESTAASTLKSFAADVAGAIRAADPNHLISLGTIGGGQCGTQGADYKDVMSVAALDLCEYHDYTPNQPIPGDQWNGLQVRLNQCNELGKPLLVGEMGVRPSDVGGTLQARANVVAGKLCAQFNAGVAGVMLWAWDKDGSLLDNFDIGPGDPVLSVLSPWSDTSVTCTDANKDGIIDTLQPSGTPSGAFVDGTLAPPTTGAIINANGLTVAITDAPNPDGVQVTVGSGAGSVQLSVCGGYTLQLNAGSTAIITCGSVKVAVRTGQALVVLGGGVTVVTISAGGVAKVADTGAGSFTVENLGATTVNVTVDGTQTTVPPNSPAKTVETWHFIGFDIPVDNSGVLNVAVAGRTVPLKWQLLDAQSNPVAALSKAVVTVQTLTCTAGTTTDNLEEYAAGASGLKNLGGGRYQFNWQTPSSYAGSCKTMKLDVGDGVIHQALFKFTK